jgi:circadian clock protein KaiC
MTSALRKTKPKREGAPKKLIPLAKTPSGIRGLDEITEGGLPKGRPTLVCGGAGCGKTLFSMEFLVRGADLYNDPGVFMSFEETERDLAENVASLGFDLARLVRQKKLVLDHVRVERNEIEATGDFDLGGLFARLGSAIDSIKAKRVVLDTVETLFGGLPNPGIIRSELRRLFEWLKEKGVTAIITGERGEKALTRHGLEEYVSDCVIFLDHRVIDQVSTRRLRVVKYRGATHGTNEYPFLIDEEGFSILPITSLVLDHSVSDERISSGVPLVDEMLGGQGWYRGSSILISGTAGTGKTSILAAYLDRAASRGERSIFFAFEESPSQLIRNMTSIGIDLAPWIKQGLLHISSTRPTTLGLEMHLVMMHRQMERWKPQHVVLDPLTNLIDAGQLQDAKALLVRIMDDMKRRGTTSVATVLGDALSSHADLGLSSMVDTWIALSNLAADGACRRTIQVVKSRGMSHSDKVTPFVITNRGMTGPKV